ncbi:MAG TPA: STAS domain-containing protein [Burkholderiaceae bacterium]|jgi:phospholipid transport system transporter-binding protein|nr:STAS domain-containing protein [Burkholderiaceae bacterium]
MFRPTLTLTINTAKTALEAGLRAIESGQAEIDLAQLTVVDSAAVATLLAWRRAARELGHSLVFSNPPANLQSLARLYGVADLLQPSSDTLRRTDLPHH